MLGLYEYNLGLYPAGLMKWQTSQNLRLSSLRRPTPLVLFSGHTSLLNSFRGASETIFCASLGISASLLLLVFVFHCRFIFLCVGFSSFLFIFFPSIKFYRHTRTHDVHQLQHLFLIRKLTNRHQVGIKPTTESSTIIFIGQVQNTGESVFIHYNPSS